MLYSLITLSYNKLACTRRCLEALVRHTRSVVPWELIVVDNGSTDGSREWCETGLIELGAACGVAVTVLRNHGRNNCSAARNLGVAAARGSHLVFVDNDVAPRTRHWLDILRGVLESEPQAGMAGAKLVYPWPPYAIQCAGVGISQRGHVCFLGRGESREDARYTVRREVQCLISACLMIPAALLREHGGFDEAFHPVQFEDFDLVYRLREAGYRAFVEPAAEMYHFESVTTQGTPTVRNAAAVVRNGLLFQKRWRHRFEQEEGPPEEACRWRRIEPKPFDEIVDPPLF